MGVVTITDIDYGQTFGPFPVSLAMADPAYLIGLLTVDKHRDDVVLKINPNDRKEGVHSVDWLPYVQPACNEEEQNVEAYLKDGHVYYRAIRIIKSQEQLYVWYSKDFCQVLGIPELPRHTNNGGQSFVCPRCGEVFTYSFPLRAHLRFRCDPHNRNGMRNAYLINNITSTRNEWPMSKSKLLEGSIKSDYLRDRTFFNDNMQHETMKVCAKRKLDDDIESPIPMKMTKNENLSSPIIPIIPYYRQTKSPSKADHNQNISVDSDPQTGGKSAFRKVEKSHSPKHGQTTSLSSIIPTTATLSPPIGLTFPASSSIPTTTQLSMAASGHSLSHRPTANLYHPRFPVISTLGIAGATVPTSMVLHKNQMNMFDIYRNGLTQPESHIREPSSDIRVLNANRAIVKHTLYPERHSVANPVLKTANPVVGSMLHSSTPAIHPTASPPMLGLAQNWCAKCNASFRMTSDLVYHMRSHHKREYDPVKKKREDKLKCTICNETFRERHHLTRHMSSHQ